MSLYGVSFVATYVAWDTVNNVGKTGDVANHTLRWVKDGTSSAPTNASTEVDATNAPGLYKLTLTATEAQAISGHVCGKSSTAGISLIPVSYTFERLPNVDPASNGGLPTVDASNQVLANVKQINGTAQTARDIGASVLLSAGTGAGQLDFTTGVVKANLVQILATALTETAGQIAAAFKQFFNIATPTSTINTITNVTNVATVTGNVNGSVNSVTTDVGITQAGADKVWGTAVRSITDKSGFALSSASIQAIYDFATSLLTTVGSIGKLFVTNLDTNIGSRLATSGYTVPPDVNTIADGLLDRTNGVETGWTLRQAMRIIAAGIGGDRSGFSTNSPVITSITKAKTRISSTNADVDGNATTTLDNT